MAEHREDGRVAYTRTHAEWVRSIVVTFACTFGIVTLLGTVVVVVWRTFVGVVGTYLGGGLAVPGLGVGAGAGALVGLLAAGTWGWLGRPRVLAGSGRRTGGHPTGAVPWPGPDGPAADGPADRAAVTS